MKTAGLSPLYSSPLSVRVAIPDIIPLMLLLLQAVAAHLPNGSPVYITVQQPAGGMPEWVKILISAGVGALFGILGSIAMEFVRPTLLAQRMKKTVRQQLIAELKNNMKSLEDLDVRVFQNTTYRERDLQPEYNIWPGTVELFLDRISNDRYQFYFEREKAALYALDDEIHLAEFYNNIETARNYCKTWNAAMLEVHVSLALGEGQQFLQSQGCVYAPSDDEKVLENNQPDKDTSTRGTR